LTIRMKKESTGIINELFGILSMSDVVEETIARYKVTTTDNLSPESDRTSEYKGCKVVEKVPYC
jgi:hypothetical protein